MKKGQKHISVLLATGVVASVIPQAQPVQAETSKSKYTDIEDSYAKNEINYLTKKQKLFGMTETTYEPFTKTSREQFAAILTRLMNLKTDNKGTRFTDVSPWAKNVVGALDKENIIAGYSDTKFGATDTLTREQMAVFFIRAMGYEDEAGEIGLELKYKDNADFSEWSKSVVAFASEIGLLVGFPDGKYYPKKETLRQDLAAVAYRFWSPEAKENPYVEKAEELIKKYKQVLTLELPKITPENVGKYVVKGKTKPNQEVEVVISHTVGKGGGKTQTVKADKDGNYKATFDLTDFPDAKLDAKATTWNGKDKKPEVVEKQIVKDLAGKEDPVKVEKVYPNGDDKVVIDFDKAPKGDEKYTFDGKPVDPKDVVIDGDKAIITVPKMEAGKEYPVTVKDADGDTLFDGKVKMETTIPTTIQANPGALSLQVGEEAKITFTAKDKDGNPAKNASILVQIKSKDAAGVEKTIKEDTVYTDNAGVVVYSYKSVDARVDSVVGIATEDAMVRSESVSVDWSLAMKGLVTVTPTDDISQGEGTYRTYKAVFKDAEGKPVPAGTKVYVDLGDQASPTTKLAGDFTIVPGETRYAEATVTGPNGEVTLKVKDVAGKTQKPLFYYDKDGDNAVGYKIEGNDPRMQAGSVKYVKQIPSIVIKEDKTGKVNVGEERKATFTVTDQFGNPYVGKLKLGLKEMIDSSNTTESGNVSFDYSIGSVNGTVAAKATTTPEIDMGAIYDAGNEKAELSVTIKGGNAKDSATIVAFVDENANGLDAADYSKELNVVFANKDIKAIDITGADKLTTIGTNLYTLAFKDEDGNPRKLKQSDLSNLVIQVLDDKGFVVQDLSATKSNLNLQADIDAATLTFADGNKIPGALVYSPTATEYDTVGVSFASDTIGDYTIRAFIDQTVGASAPNNVLEQEETVATKKIKVEKAVLTNTAAKVTANFSYDDTEESMLAQLLDQNGNPFNASEDVLATVTIKNDGNKTFTLNSVGATDIVNKKIAANETVTVSVIIKAGESSYEISVKPDKTTGKTSNLEVTTSVKTSTLDIHDENDIYFVDLNENIENLATQTSDFVFTGEIVGYEPDEYSQYYIIKYTQSGATKYARVAYELTTANPAHTFTVDGSTNNGILFGESLSERDIIKVTFDSTTKKITHNLTNVK